jgi:hypothetical protein
MKSQLERFANAFPKYCKLVDNARLYSTNIVGVLPKVKIYRNIGFSLMHV